MFVGLPTLEHATCPCEKHGSQCCHAICETFPRKDEAGWVGRRFHVSMGSSDTRTHTGATCRVGGTVLSSRQQNVSLERLRRWRSVLSVDREQKKDGRRLDKLCVITFRNATQLQVQFIIHFLPVSTGFHFHMHSVHFSVFSVHYAQCTSRPWHHTSTCRITDITQ